MADETAPAASDAATRRPASPVLKEEVKTEAVADAPTNSENSAAVEVELEKAIKESEPTQNNPTSTPAPTTENVETKDAAGTDAPATAVAEIAPQTVKDSTTKTPATPTTAKKMNGSTSSKKKTAGVPEHKSKKLNKKKSKVELRLDCQPGELYLARMKGHAPWPSIICDEEMLPESLLSSRPVTTALADGTFKRADYAPGGKRESERTYPIMFLYTNEFAWLPNMDLTPITPEDCSNVEQKGKAKGLLAAYDIAGEDHDLQYYKTMLADHQAAVQEDLDRQAEKEAERAAAKAAKAEKNARRKSTTAAEKDDDDDDQMDIDQDSNTQKTPSKKRKKVADAEDEDETEGKPAKTPKLKLNGPKTPSTDKKAPPKSKPSTKKAAAKKDSDEEMEDETALEATPLSAAEVKDKKEKEIRYYRHKLQRGLLSRDDPPSDEEVAHASGYLGKLETYPGLEGDIIRSTKIHKVLRAMIRLPSIPKDETYNLKKRAVELLQKWTSILGGDGGADGGIEGNAEPAAATTTTEAADKSDATGKTSEAVTASKPENDGQDEEKASTGSEHKVNGTTEKPAQDAKSEARKSSELTTRESKSDTPTTANGIEKPAHPETQSDAPQTEEKPVETVEASS